MKREKGRLDIVFANAGVGEVRAAWQDHRGASDWTFDINVKGLLFTVQKALPLMPDGASIILNASIVASKGRPQQRVQRHQSRYPFFRADMDNGPEGSPHSRERDEPGLHRHARTQ